MEENEMHVLKAEGELFYYMNNVLVSFKKGDKK